MDAKDRVHHQTSEIPEEEFTADLQKVEDVRLREIAKARTLVREKETSGGGADDDDDYSYEVDISDEMCISREQIENLHCDLSGLALHNNSQTSSVRPGLILAQGHRPDYMNQELVDQIPITISHSSDKHDYMNQAGVDPVASPRQQDDHDYMNQQGIDQVNLGGQDDDRHDYMNQDAVEEVSIIDQQSKKKKHDYMNQVVVDRVNNERCASATTVSLAPPVSSSTPGNPGNNAQLLQHVSSSNGYQSKGSQIKHKPAVHQQQQLPSQGNLSEYETRLLLAKRASKHPMPNIYDIPWYHPGISRHVAESMLLSKSIRDGTYLLRDCVADENTITLSVRCQESVKHYKVVWDGKQFVFGLGKFPSVDDFKEHFLHQPVISGDSVVLLQLCYPYPRGVSEPAIYHDANVIDLELANLQTTNSTTSNTTTTTTAIPAPSQSAAKSVSKNMIASSVDLSVNSKEGYLTKLGFHRKNWKKRWFVLYRNELKYYNSCGDKDPLRVIHLGEVTRVARDGSAGKPNCLRLVTPTRTFYMYASSEVEAVEWLQILDWRLKQQISASSSAS